MYCLRLAGAASALSLLLAPLSAHAALTITSAGATDGFSLSNVVTGLSSPCCGYGAWGSAVLGNGNLVLNTYNPANTSQTVNMVFTDVDGHAVGDALSTSVWNDGAYASSLASLKGVVYGTHYGDNTTRIVNSDGSEGTVVSNVGRGGIGADLARNSLLVATDAGVEEIDLSNANPATNHHVVAAVYADGVTVSPDGTVVYAETGGRILGYNIATGVQVYDSGSIGSPDGVGVIIGGSLNGDLVVNDNGGVVNLLNPGAHTLVQIANGGSRGDYVGFDPTNGTLFLSQTDRLMRLSLAGAAIGGGGGITAPGVPEPATWITLILGVFGMGAVFRRRRSDAHSTAGLGA